MLLKENGLFLADERVVPLLPKLLGVKWFEAKKCVFSSFSLVDHDHVAHRNQTTDPSVLKAQRSKRRARTRHFLDVHESK